MNLEELIQKHKPWPGSENQPCGSGQLFHLNEHGLIQEALERQVARDSESEDDDRPPVISRIVAWEILAEAQRNGLRLRPQRYDPESFRGRPRAAS
jgi:hypothetical protein